MTTATVPTTRRLASARALAAFAVALPLAAFAQTPAPATAPKPTDKPAVEKLETFEVTGSRIKRIDAETPSPVIRFTAADLQATGFTNVDDALRALPINSGQSIVPEGSGNGFASGTSTVNLRGLGNNNTLVLINGRRAVPSGAGLFNGFQSAIDLRQIPTAAIEALEVLKDGASAIYGSDAVAGVINIRLRRNYTGLTTEITAGNTFHKDSFERSAFAIAGAAAGQTSIQATVNYSHRNQTKDSDFNFSKTADLRYDKTSAAQLEADITGNILVGADLRSATTFPARYFIPGTATVRTFLNTTTSPLIANGVAVSRVTGAGLYDFQQDTTQTPEHDTRGLSVVMRHNFNDQIYGFADLFYNKVQGVSQSAPSPFTTTDKGAGTNGRLVVSADNPFNPYGTRFLGAAGQSIELSTFRLVNAGPRINDTRSEYPRGIFGLGGTLGGDWSWEGAFMTAAGSFENLSPNVSFDSQVQQALLGVTIDGQRLFANPFGPEDPRVTKFYSGKNPTKTEFNSNLYDISINGSLVQTPWKSGAIGLAAGFEYRKENLTDTRTVENETGNIVGGSEGFGYYGKRQVTSQYLEVKVPFPNHIELQLAARHEEYSDFGNTTKPKVALGWKPVSWLMLRGSYSESFKAPDLAFLYTKGSVSFTAGQVFDPRRTDQPSAQLKTVGRGNAGLQPEETKTTYLGFVLDVPRGPLKGLSADVSYFKFNQKNLITRDGAAFTLTNELRLPAGRVIRKTLTPAEAAAGFTVGIIDAIATDWFNANKVLLDGWDFGVSYRYKTERLGQFNLGLNATYLANFERTTLNSLGVLTLIDIDGNDNVPLVRGTGTLSWRKGNWAASAFVSMVGHFPPVGITAGPEPLYNNQWRVNPQVSYNALWGSKLTVGVRNAFDKAPPRYMENSTGYYNGVGSAEGAFWFVRVSRDF
ncbi:MAG: hypothetical protein RLZZ15_1770 [Verrucomicrobiota bacterium]